MVDRFGADNEASLLRAGPKDPASRIRPILRPQPQCANPDDQRTAVIAAAGRQPVLAAPVLGVADPFGHLRFERRLDQRFDCGTHEILTQREQSFELDNFPFYPQPWSWCAPFTGSVTSNITSMP